MSHTTKERGPSPCWYHMFLLSSMYTDAFRTCTIRACEHKGPLPSEDLDSPFDLQDSICGYATRLAKVSTLDTCATDLAQWNLFLQHLASRGIKGLILQNDRPDFGNSIYRAFANLTLKAYVSALERNGIRTTVI